MEKEFYIGQIFNEQYPPEVAVWCNNNNAFIDEIQNRVYEIKAIPEPTIEDKEKNIKSIRNEMLNSISWRVDRAREQRELGIKTVDNYYNLIHYKQYLRDYPEKVENWWEQNPLEFEEWEKQYEYRQES